MKTETALKYKLSRKEELYVTAIQNLVRMNNFRNLLYNLDNKYITKKQFENKLKKHSNLYTITVGKFKSEDDFEIISQIVSEAGLEKLYDDLSTGDVGELFSVDTQHIHSFIEKHNG